MHVPLVKRLVIAICNVIFPPVAVGLLTGFSSRDTLLNSCLFLLAVIPSHVHGFWVSCTYFTRKRRARKGKYPGEPYKTCIWSEKVLTGGVGWEESERLKDARARRTRTNDSGHDSDFDSRRTSRTNSGRSSRRTSRHGARRSRSKNEPHLQTEGGYTDAQMREAQNVSRVGSQVSRTSRHF